MKRVIFIALVWLGVAAASVHAQTPEAEMLTVFAEGNSLYESGDYAGAVARYETLVAAGVEDPTLFYNAANAYYKIQNLGYAVLYYERALRLVPRDTGIKENLELVETQLIDKQFVAKGNRLAQAAIFLHNNMSAAEMSWLSFAGYFLLCVFGVFFVFRHTGVVAAAYRRTSLLSPGRLIGLSRTQDMLAWIVVVGFLFVTTGVSATVKSRDRTHRAHAVIVVKEVSVYSSPTRDATLEFKLHEGTRVTIEEGRSNWAKVRLPGDLDGWVETAATERI